MRGWAELGLVFVVACGSVTARREGTEVDDCVDRADNDGDGRFDCDDEGCAGSPDCRDVGGGDAGTDMRDAGADPEVGNLCVPPVGLECDEGTWCVPNPAMEGLGNCELFGPGEHGDECVVQADCAAPMICVETGVCRRSCAVATAERDCATVTADSCTLLPGGALVGWCDRFCTVFGNDPACPAGEWCDGRCRPVGAGMEGDTCGRGFPLCGVGLGCRNDECAPRCAPGATPGSAGDTCEGSDLCFGFCAPACDYDGARTCPDPEDVCLPVEAFGVGDHCRRLEVDLSPGESCNDAGLAPGDFCGAFRLCLGGEPSLCADLCRPSVQAYGTTAHPDCGDVRATCTDSGVPDLAYGYCDAP